MVCEFKKEPVFIDNKFGDGLIYKNPRINPRYFGAGPIFDSYVDEKGVLHENWEDKHAKATWEINWPSKKVHEWPNELVGIMDFEAEEWWLSNPGCH